MMPVEYDVTGKVVFITGAGGGIGKGIAQVLAEAGADVAINALTPKYVEPLPDCVRALSHEVERHESDSTLSLPAQEANEVGIRHRREGMAGHRRLGQ